MMAPPAAESELLQRIVADTVPPEEEGAAVERLIHEQPQIALSLVPVYLQQKHGYRGAWEEASRNLAELNAALQEPPWHPATVIRLLPGAEERALVAANGRRLAVRLGPGVDRGALRCGTGVFLDHGMRVLLAAANTVPPSGAIGAFSRFHDSLAVLKGAGDEELVVDVAEAVLAEGLKEGDLLLYDRESRVAIAKIARDGGSGCLLEEIPDVTFDHIGGLDEVLEEITDEASLHLCHHEVVARHGLKPARGVLLTGPPGCGKTMIAKALANHLSRLKGIQATFLNVKPGVHRAMFYGQTEQRIRELFASARRAADGEGRIAVLFFDDMDHLGSRSDGVSTAIDTRVLPSFLGEIDGLADCHRVWLMGATNRPDLLDEALIRPGRFGDRVFRIPRPSRRAAQEIFRKHLPPELPYYSNNGKSPDHAAAEMIETALARLYAPNGEAFSLGTLLFRDGTRAPLTAPQVMSGALIAQAVAEAKRQSCLRAVRGQPLGLTTAGLLVALDRQLSAIAHRLKPGPGLRQMLDLPEDRDVVKVELDPRRKLPGSHEYFR
jgi:proteasome-associated ATPase